jgi:hypothetical protein
VVVVVLGQHRLLYLAVGGAAFKADVVGRRLRRQRRALAITSPSLSVTIARMQRASTCPPSGRRTW